MKTEQRIELFNPTDTVTRLDSLESQFLTTIRAMRRVLSDYIAAQVRRGVNPSAIVLPRSYRFKFADELTKCLVNTELMARAQARFECQRGAHLARTEYFAGDDVPAQFAEPATMQDLTDSMSPTQGLTWYKNYSLALVATQEEATLNKVRDAIIQSVKKGWGTKKSMQAVGEVLQGVSGYYLERVVRTEMAKIYEQARIKEFEADDTVIGYELSAILDSRVCEACRHREGVQIRKEDLGQYRLTPPFHPFCRCVFLPIFTWEEKAGVVDWKQVPEDAAPIPLGFGHKDMHIPGATLGPSPDLLAKKAYHAKKKAEATNAKKALSDAEALAAKAEQQAKDAAKIDALGDVAIEARALQATLNAEAALARQAAQEAILTADKAKQDLDAAIKAKLAEKKAKKAEAHKKWGLKVKTKKLEQAFATEGQYDAGVGGITPAKYKAAQKLIAKYKIEEPDMYAQVIAKLTGMTVNEAAVVVSVGATNTAVAAQKVIDSVFPDSLGKLTTVKSLGGSTGAKLVKDVDSGLLFVMKEGNSEAHLLEETYADAAYKAMGVDVPDFKVYKNANGKSVKLSRYLENAQPLSAYDGLAEYAAIKEELQKNFAVDAILGNWDVVGLGADNVMVQKAVDGTLKVFRIDNGGSFRYRAQGTKKTDAQWNAFPDEFWTLRDFSTNSSAAKVFDGMPWSDIKKQVEKIYLEKDKLLAAIPDDLKDIVEQRIDNSLAVMQKYHSSLQAKAAMNQAKLGGITLDKPIQPDTLKTAGNASGVTATTSKAQKTTNQSKSTSSTASAQAWKPKLTATESKKFIKGSDVQNDLFVYFESSSVEKAALKDGIAFKQLPKKDFGTGIVASFHDEALSHTSKATVKVQVKNPMTIDRKLMGEDLFKLKVKEFHDEIAEKWGTAGVAPSQDLIDKHFGELLKSKGYDGLIYIDAQGKKRLYVYDKQQVAITTVAQKQTVSYQSPQMYTQPKFSGLAKPVNEDTKAKPVKLPGQTVKGKFKAFSDANKSEMDRWFESTMSYADAKKIYTQEEFSSLRTYTGSSYRTINDALRDAKKYQTKCTNKHALEIEKAMKRKESKMPENIVLYRSFTDPKKGIDDWLSMVGENYDDPGFWSTGLSHNFCKFWSGDVKARILAPKGTRGVTVKTFSQHESEQEVLLSGKNKFRIIAAERHEGVVWVDMEVIGEVD